MKRDNFGPRSSTAERPKMPEYEGENPNDCYVSVPQRRNISLKGSPPSAQLSRTAASMKTLKKYSNVENGIKNKLSYEWKTIYRRLNADDANNSGQIPMSKFERTLRQTKTFLSREDLSMIKS